MTARTSWTAGNGQGLTSWGSAFNSSDLASMPNGYSVLSSVADIANDSALDTYADVAFEIAIPSTTLAVGAGLSLFLFDKFEIDGSNNYYGDNSLGTGASQKNYTPNYRPVGMQPATIIGAAQTLVVGMFPGILLPPRKFRFAITNSLGVTLNSSGHTISYVTYNINLND